MNRAWLKIVSWHPRGAEIGDFPTTTAGSDDFFLSFSIGIVVDD